MRTPKPWADSGGFATFGSSMVRPSDGHPSGAAARMYLMHGRLLQKYEHAPGTGPTASQAKLDGRPMQHTSSKIKLQHLDTSTKSSDQGDGIMSTSMC